MPVRETKRSKKVIIALLVVLVAITLLAMKYHRYVQLKYVATHQYDSVEAVLSDVEKLGGQLVHCQRGECRARNSGKRVEVEEPSDGNYILYPPESDVPAEVIEHQSEEIRRLTSNHRL
jgi:uncharacterized membrane protein YcjF (UPF0283 family)